MGCAESSINCITVIYEKHQVPITNSGNDGVQILHFLSQQHHSGSLSAVLAGMVQHHIEKVTKLAGDARVMHIKEDSRKNFSTCFSTLVGVDFIQQSHDLFTQAKSSGVAGRRCALRLPHKAEEAHESCESQLHVGNTPPLTTAGPAAGAAFQAGQREAGCRIKHGVKKKKEKKKTEDDV